MAAVFANSRVRVTPMTGDEGHSQGPLAGQDHSTQKHLVERMEAEGDDWAIWQWNPLALTYAPTFRPRSHRVRRHPVVVAARLAARLALTAARSAASRAAASATKVALKHGLIAAPRQVIPNAIKWGPQVAGRAGVNQATRTIGRAARRRVGATPGRVVGSAGLRSRQAVTRTAEVARPRGRRGGRPQAGFLEVGGHAGWTSSSRPQEPPRWGILGE
jgi:hypothetical protein